MSRDRLPPPQPEACLTTSRASRYKGGTLIAEGVWSVDEHERRLCSPDGYRPAACARCHGGRLHVHDYLAQLPQSIGWIGPRAALRRPISQ